MTELESRLRCAREYMTELGGRLRNARENIDDNVKWLGLAVIHLESECPESEQYMVGEIRSSLAHLEQARKQINYLAIDIQVKEMERQLAELKRAQVEE